MSHAVRTLRPLLGLLPFAAGCETTIDYMGSGHLFTETEPGRVYDAGTLPIGRPTVVSITLAATNSDVTVTEVSITPTSTDEGAFFTLDAWEAIVGAPLDEALNGDVVRGGASVVVDTRSVGFEWPLVFFAPTEAWVEAVVTFTYTDGVHGRTSSTSQAIRAAALPSGVAVLTPVVDFGDDGDGLADEDDAPR